MTRYLLLNGGVTVFMLVATIYLTQKNTGLRRQMAQIAAPMLLLTAIFDPLIIFSGVVAYNRQLTLGLNFFNAPIEDFMYTLVAVMLVPLLWRYYGKH